MDKEQEIKHLKDELALYKAHFTAISKFAAEAIVTVNSQGKILFWNSGAENMFGYSANEMVGSFAYKLIPRRFQKTIKNEILLNSNNSRRVTDNNIVEAKAVSADGAEFHVELSISSWVEKEERYYMAIIRDISKRKRSNEELIRVQKLESVGSIASGIAHDFNNILTGVITDLFAAKLNLLTDSEEYRLLVNAEESVFRAISLAKQFMDFSANTKTSTKESLDLIPVIEEAIGFTLSGSNVNYTFTVDDDIGVVDADRGQINQAVSNIILNSSQAMPDGGTVNVKVNSVEIDKNSGATSDDILDIRSGSYMKVSISDSGVGIKDENLGKIFDPYYTTKKSGSGFGLATAYFIIKRHGGTITVNSSHKDGSTFVFYLPTVSVDIEKGDEGEKMEKKELKPNGTVLVMDDDHSVQKALEIVLKHIGFSVKITSTGEEAIAEYKKNVDNGEQFSAVIMDLTIPGHMGGKEAVGKILDIDDSAKVIVTTGYSADPIMMEYEKYGFCATISKPFTIDVVKGVLAEVAEE